MKKNLYPGKLIVIAGSDGSGKATQTKLLISSLKKKGHKVKMFDFPRYGNPSAYFIESYLNGNYGSASEVSPKLASLFYALDRFDAKNSLIDRLEKGYILVSNRYVSANQGHQGGKISNKKKRIEFFNWLENLEYEICGIPKPDINIYLNVPWKLGQKLVDKKGYRKYLKAQKRDIHEKDKNHLKEAQNSYNYLINYESNWKKINCINKGKLLDKQSIHKKVLNIVEKII